MWSHPLDHPFIISNLFYPRAAQSGTSRIPGAGHSDLIMIGMQVDFNAITAFIG